MYSSTSSTILITIRADTVSAHKTKKEVCMWISDSGPLIKVHLFTKKDKELHLLDYKHVLNVKLERECEEIERKVYDQVFVQTQDDLAATTASKKASLDAKEIGLREIEVKLASFAEVEELEERKYPCFFDFENGLYFTDSLNYYLLNSEPLPTKSGIFHLYDYEDFLDRFVSRAIENDFDFMFASLVSINEIKKILAAGKEITWLPGGEKIELSDLEPKKMKTKMRKLRATMRKLRAEKDA